MFVMRDLIVVCRAGDSPEALKEGHACHERLYPGNSADNVDLETVDLPPKRPSCCHFQLPWKGTTSEWQIAQEPRVVEVGEATGAGQCSAAIDIPTAANFLKFRNCNVVDPLGVRET